MWFFLCSFQLEQCIHQSFSWTCAHGEKRCGSRTAFISHSLHWKGRHTNRYITIFTGNFCKENWTAQLSSHWRWCWQKRLFYFPGEKLSRVGPLEGCQIPSYSGFFTVSKKYNSNIFFWFYPAQVRFDVDVIFLWPWAKRWNRRPPQWGPFKIRVFDATPEPLFSVKFSKKKKRILHQSSPGNHTSCKTWKKKWNKEKTEQIVEFFLGLFLFAATDPVFFG